MKITETKLEGVLLIEPEVFKDFRGSFTEIYNEDAYAKAGIADRFVQDDMSLSKKNVLRGIHVENKIAKLVMCGHGRLYCVVVNCDKASKKFGAWESFILTDENRHQLFIPPKHGTAYLVLSDWGMFHYKQSGYYNPANQDSYRWNDPKFNISWPIENPILSARDEAGKYV